jgi:hypothetical protein
MLKVAHTASNSVFAPGFLFGNLALDSRRDGCAMPNIARTPQDGYRPNVGLCVVDSFTSAVLVFQRQDAGMSWSLPQCGINRDETELQAGECTVWLTLPDSASLRA